MFRNKLIGSIILTATMVVAIPKMNYDKFPLHNFDENSRASPIDTAENEVDEPGSSIPGVPGRDYPTYGIIPKTEFTCNERIPGFYADEEAGCQVWHYCRKDGSVDSFLCPNGTVYNQENKVCEWWFNVKCELETSLPEEESDVPFYSEEDDDLSDDNSEEF